MTSSSSWSLLRHGFSTLLVFGILNACTPRGAPPSSTTATPPPVPIVDKLVLQRASFADLINFNDDRLSQALPALQRSCARMINGGDLGIAGQPQDWAAPCAEIANLKVGNDAGLRATLMRHFEPVLATNNGKAEGLFTGYYEPTLKGARKQSTRYNVPLYGRPNDLITVDLGQFRDNLKGQRIAGKVEGGTLKPYATRGEIDNGALGPKAPVLVWVADPIDAFFLHVQGSGRVELAEGGIFRVGYAAQNGHAYNAIGRSLVARGAMTQEQVSLQSIRAWLAANPTQARAVMAENPSFVFFRELNGDGPLGAQGVVLEPGRSLAVDRSFLNLGLPIWLDAVRPDADPNKPDLPFRRLMVAQDTGGAIKGPVRGDVFWGHDAQAPEIAGRMKHQGRYFLLLPKAVAARALATS